MDKIQNLTDKLYQEGVQKGKEEANRIVSEAEEKSKSIIAEAEKKAKEIISGAEKKSGELKKNTEAELKLFARQSVEALKTEITNLINGDVVSASVKEAVADKEFMQKVILNFVNKLASEGDVTIQTEDAKELSQYFKSVSKEALNKGLKIEEVNGLKSSFVVVAEGGEYKVQFGEEELVEYFKEFLRPQLVKMLFK